MKSLTVFGNTTCRPTWLGLGEHRHCHGVGQKRPALRRRRDDGGKALFPRRNGCRTRTRSTQRTSTAATWSPGESLRGMRQGNFCRQDRVRRLDRGAGTSRSLLCTFQDWLFVSSDVVAPISLGKGRCHVDAAIVWLLGLFRQSPRAQSRSSKLSGGQGAGVVGLVDGTSGSCWDRWLLGYWALIGASTWCRCHAASEVWQQLVLVRRVAMSRGLPCCGGPLSQCVESCGWRGRGGLAYVHFSFSVCNLSRVNQWQICCAFAEAVHPWRSKRCVLICSCLDTSLGVYAGPWTG